jgi:hypothetical protein
LKTYVVFALDCSSSINFYGLTQPVINAYNDQLRVVRARAEAGENVSVALVVFSDWADVKVFPTDPRQLPDLTSTQYRPYGNTALFDGIGKGVELLESQPDARNEDTSFLLIGITDGEENQSSRFNAFSIKRLIEQRQNVANGRWTIAFNVPRGFKDKFVRTFGFPEGNVREWETTAQGMRETSQVTDAGLNNYFAGRARGMKSVTTFYATSDLSGVDANALKKKLVDLSPNFKSLTVDKEQSIKEFVEDKTKRPYVIGSAYYCLTKPEKVQPAKAVLLMEKGKKAIWGGEEARRLVGLPTDGASHAKLTPGNHANYDVYIASTSVNRKLVRGTKVLVDLNKTKDDQETWDSKTAVRT